MYIVYTLGILCFKYIFMENMGSFMVVRNIKELFKKNCAKK